jgi:putative flippase GtrA
MIVVPKLIRYFFMAGAAAIVDVGGFAFLCLTPMPIAVAAATSFCIATVAKFPLVCRYVFNCSPTFKGFGLFFVAATGGLCINVCVTAVGSLYLGIEPVVAKIIGVGSTFLINFWVNLRIVFRTPRDSIRN